jgi:hypothetical protein
VHFPRVATSGVFFPAARLDFPHIRLFSRLRPFPLSRACLRPRLRHLPPQFDYVRGTPAPATFAALPRCARLSCGAAPPCQIDKRRQNPTEPPRTRFLPSGNRSAPFFPPRTTSFAILRQDRPAPQTGTRGDSPVTVSPPLIHSG